MMYRSSTIVIIALCLASIFFFTFEIWEYMFSAPFVPPDPYSYIDSANELYENLKPHPYRTIGFALILGIPNLFIETFEIKQYIVYGVLLNLIAWIGMLVLLQKSLNIYFDKKASFWLTILSVASIGSMSQIFLVLTESVTAFFLVFIANRLLRYRENGLFRNLIIATAMLNFLVLIRPGFLYLGLLATALLFVFGLVKKAKWGSISILFFSSIAAIGLQLFMMQNTYGKTTVSFIDKVTWYYYLGAEAKAAVSNHDYMQELEMRRAELRSKSYGDILSTCSTDAKDQIKNNFTIVIREYSKNIIENSYGGAYVLTAIKEARKNTGKNLQWLAQALFWLSRLQNVFYILLFVFSLGLLLLSKFNLSLYVLSAIVGYIILTSGISFWQGDRFHFILYPLILILAVILLQQRKIAGKWLTPSR